MYTLFYLWELRVIWIHVFQETSKWPFNVKIRFKSTVKPHPTIRRIARQPPLSHKSVGPFRREIKSQQERREFVRSRSLLIHALPAGHGAGFSGALLVWGGFDDGPGLMMLWVFLNINLSHEELVAEIWSFWSLIHHLTERQDRVIVYEWADARVALPRAIFCLD